MGILTKYFTTDYMSQHRNIWEDFLKSNMFVLFPGSVSKGGSGTLSPELLDSLQSLRDNVDSALLPHSLHQVCKGGFFSPHAFSR